MSIFREILAAGLAFTLLLFWRELSAEHCVSLVIPLLIIVVIAMNRREYALRRRRCMVNCTFTRESGIYHLLTGHWLVTVSAIFFAVMSGGVLALQLVTWRDELLLLLAIDLAMLWGIYHLLSVILKPITRIEMHEVLTKKLAAYSNTFLLLMAMVWTQLHSPFPEYLVANSLMQSLVAASSAYSSNCLVTQQLVQLLLEQEVIGFWLMLHATDEIDSLFLQWLSWGIFLAVNAIGLSGLSRYFTQIIAFAGGRNRGE